MNRQLYMGGGITQLSMNEIMVPRGEYGLGSIVKSVGKAVKGVTKGIGDIAKSDIGKAALLAAGAYYAPALFGGTVGFGPTSTYGSFARGLMSPNLIGPMTKAGSLGRTISSAVTGGGAVSNLLTGKTGMALSAVGGGLIGYLSSQGISNEEIEEIQRDPATLSTYLRQYYTNLNPELINQPEVVDKFVKSQLAEYGYATGGRVGFSDGGNDDLEYKGWKKIFLKSNDAAESHPRHSEFIKRFAEETMGKDRSPEVTIKKAYGGLMGRQEYGLGGLISQMINNNPEIFKKLQMASPVKQLQAKYMMNLNPRMDEEEVMEYIRENAAYGGPMGEPRENKGGIMELDYRKEGGFVPVGIKEKADDVPAMLSKNEFVFTADAVRGAGEGSVDKGAERLYNIMKTLENGGTV